MVLKHICTFIFFFIPILTIAGENQSLYLTGNPNVDFFSNINRQLIDEKKYSLYSLTYDQDNSSENGKKSPWLAGALSLVVPGAGEIYSENYVMGGVFFAIEAASWITAIVYDNKGNKQTNIFQDYANAHWNAVRYTNWTLDNIGHLNPYVTTPTPSLTPREYYHYSIYGKADPVNPDDQAPPFGCINWMYLNQMERAIAEGQQNGYTHTLPPYGDQQYYELIGKYDQFSRGWDDSDPTSDLESEIPIKSTSKKFYEYALMRAKANDYYDVASAFVSVAIVNHIVSALDAFWSATRYNNRLHAEINMKIQPTPFGSVPVTEAKIKYSF